MEWRAPSIYKKEWMRNFVTMLTFISFVFCAVTIIVAILTEKANTFIKIVMVIWLLVPPAWFWVEYIFIFNKKKKDDDLYDSFERLKYRQTLGRNVWAAVVAFLFFKFFNG